MAEAKKKQMSSRCWWLGTHATTKLSRSPWLQSTLQELDEKTNAMLKVIEEDADSFAQRAEMYYKKRPELISMVEEFYRAHRSLAERYDQAKSDGGIRHSTTWTSQLSLPKSRLEKLTSPSEKSYDSYSETYDHEESSGESEVEDPEEEEEIQFDKEIEQEEVSSGVCDDELTKLREAIEELKEENRAQKEELLRKDEAKREAIRQLSLAVDMLKEENSELRKKIVKDTPNKKKSPFEFNKLKSVFWGRRLFNE